MHFVSIGICIVAIFFNREIHVGEENFEKVANFLT